MKQSIIILIVVCGLLLGCSSKSSKQTARTGPPKNDMEFAKEVFELLAEGDQAVAELIDWENLKMLGINVGETYRRIKDEGELRARFGKGFIRGYSNSFKKSGGRVGDTSNWREQSRDSLNTFIIADAPGAKVLSMTVTHIDAQQKVSTIDLK